MGLLTDIFAATPEAAAGVDPETWTEVAQSFDILHECPGFEPALTFEALEEVLVGAPPGEAAIRTSPSGRCWIYELREPLVAALAAERNWGEVSDAWAAASDGDSVVFDPDFLAELSRFVRTATSRRLRVYAWGSL